MSNNPRDGFTLSHDAAIAAFVCISAALELSVEYAAFPERLKINENGPRTRLDALSRNLLREVKSVPTHGLSESDEAQGIKAAIKTLEDVIARLRG
jgi:hypothetical protein